MPQQFKRGEILEGYRATWEAVKRLQADPEMMAELRRIAEEKIAERRASNG